MLYLHIWRGVPRAFGRSLVLPGLVVRLHFAWPRRFLHGLWHWFPGSFRGRSLVFIPHKPGPECPLSNLMLVSKSIYLVQSCIYNVITLYSGF